ncbi:MAG: peptide ABC transporter substrate-binding protein [Phycisphaerales bacterium]|nr:peptide ABC transporter substrate-binding protein [Phycisphaerales bacterium]
MLLGGAWLSGRRSDVRPAPDFRYVHSSDVHTLDPARMSWTQDLRIALNLWEGLCAYDPSTLSPVAGAAGYPPEVSPDGLTWTFHLREDGRWSNGDAVRSSDFVRGWRRAMEPGTAADYAFFVTNHVAGARAYAEWRTEAMQVLTALSRRAEGWPLDARQVEALLTLECARPVREAWEALKRASANAGGEGATPGHAAALGDAALPWRELHAEVMRRHVARMDEQFAEVGLETPDERTLVGRLVKPCPFFSDLVAFPALSPIHESLELLRERWGDAPLTREGLVTYDAQWTKPDYRKSGYPGLVTNGPYRLADWTFKRSLRLEVNPFHREAARIPCRSIEAVVYDDPNTALLAFESGDVDFIPTVEVSYDHEIARLARSGERADFHLCSLAGTYFFNFNCCDAVVDGRPNPFVDARVRRAFCLAVDRRAIAEQVLQRGDRPAEAFVPPGTMPGYEPPAGLGFDPASAQSLLAEAGFPHGEGLPVIELLFNTGGPHGSICQAAARMWETHLGVRIELRGKESKTFAEDKASRRFMIARANWYADYNDPTTFLDVLSCGNGNNDSGYCREEYDALLAAASVERDATRRMSLLREAESLIASHDCPILPLFHYTSVTAIRPGVTGLTPNARLLFPFRAVSVAR